MQLPLWAKLVALLPLPGTWLVAQGTHSVDGVGLLDLIDTGVSLAFLAFFVLGKIVPVSALERERQWAERERERTERLESLITKEVVPALTLLAPILQRLGATSESGRGG